MIERRKYARLNITADVKYKIIGRGHSIKEPAECNNISPEGLCLIFRDGAAIKCGAKLDIEIKIEANKPFTMIGEVIWIKKVAAKEKHKGESYAGIKILEIYNNDENRFLLQLCDRMIQKLNKEYPTAR